MFPYQKLPNKFEKEIETLTQNVIEHPALKNSFYDRWMKSSLSIKQFEIFAINYFARVSKTPDRLTSIFISIPDYQSRQIIMHNLNDEMGNGYNDAVHVGLLHHWLDDLHKKIGGRGMEYILENHQPTDETLLSLKKIKSLSEKNAPSAAGILLGQEATGLFQIEYLYEGFRNYKDLYAPGEFNDVAAYHHVHLGLIEKSHVKGARIIAARNSPNQKDFGMMSDAYKIYLESVANSWSSVSREINMLSSKDLKK